MARGDYLNGTDHRIASESDRFGVICACGRQFKTPDGHEAHRDEVKSRKGTVSKVSYTTLDIWNIAR